MRDLRAGQRPEPADRRQAVLHSRVLRGRDGADHTPFSAFFTPRSRHRGTRRPIFAGMARADAAPYPAELTHLRPTDAAGLRVAGMAIAGTALGFLLSFVGGVGLWICGQVLL